MKRFLAAALLAAAAVGHAGTALADDIEVKANKATLVGWRAIYSLIGCELRPPDTYSVGRQPEHGKVTLSLRQVTSKSTENGCNGFRGKAVAVTYTPERGYRGPDSFTVRIGYQRYSGPAPFGDVKRYTVTVK